MGKEKQDLIIKKKAQKLNYKVFKINGLWYFEYSEPDIQGLTNEWMNRHLDLLKRVLK